MAKSERQGFNESEQGTISCGHIWEISFLIYNKIPFLGTESRNGKVVFIFPCTVEVEHLLQAFVMNPEVHLQEYISVFQRVKNLIYAEKGKGERINGKENKMET